MTVALLTNQTGQTAYDAINAAIALVNAVEASTDNNAAGLSSLAATTVGLQNQLALVRAALEAELATEVTSRAQGDANVTSSLSASIASEVANRIAAAASSAIRPGDGPTLFTQGAVTGPAYGLPGLAPASLVIGDNGNAARLYAAGIIAARQQTALELGRIYRIRFVFQRRADVSDPSNHTIRCAVAWLDQGSSLLPGAAGITVLQDDLAPHVSAGRQVYEATVGRSAPQASVAAPVNAVYARPFVQTFGEDGSTDVEVIDVVDITEAAIVPDIAANAVQRITALESVNAAARIQNLESEVQNPNSLTFATLSDAASATITASVTTIMTRGQVTAGDGLDGLYARTTQNGAAAGPAGASFTSADGAYWLRVDHSIHPYDFSDAILAGLAVSLPRSQLGTAYIPAPITTIRFNGFAAQGDKGRDAPYVRGTANGLMAVQDAFGAWWNLLLSAGLCNVGWFGAKGDGVTDDGPAFQAANNAFTLVGGGDLIVPDGLLPYRIATGVTLTHGVKLKGSGGRSWYGSNSDPTTWSNRGAWLLPADMVNPCITLAAPGTGVEGLNFSYQHAAPGPGWQPTVYPWTIHVTQSFFKLSNLMIVGGYDGIFVEYPSANGGGTYSSMEDIFLSCFNIGRMFKNVNDTMAGRNIRHRNMWYPLSADVKKWQLANAIGDWFEYIDNLQETDVEYFGLHIAQFFKDSTVNAGGFNITHAAGYLQLNNISFNNVHQAVNVDTAQTGLQVHYRGVLAQWDNTDTNPAANFFNFASDYASIILEGLRLTEVGLSAIAVGGGSLGFVSLAGALSIGSRIGGGGYSAATAAGGQGSPCFNVFFGATLSMSAGFQDVFGSTNGRAAEVFRGAGIVQGPLFAGSTRFLNDNRAGYVQIVPPAITDTYGGTIEWYNSANHRLGYIGHPGADATLTLGSDGDPSVTPRAAGASLALRGDGKAQVGAIGVGTGAVQSTGGVLSTTAASS